MKIFNHRKRATALAAALVIGAVCASYGVDRPSQGGGVGSKATKTAPDEAPRVLASFEASYLGAWAEDGAVKSKDDLVIDIAEINANSKWFVYEISANGQSCKAIAKAAIGNFKNGDYIMTTWSGNENDGFVHSSNNEEGIRYLIPNFFRK
jgi:hypothetical protein